MVNNVYIGISTTNSLISKAIRFFTRSEASHCWFRFWDDCLKAWLVFTSNSSGFEIELYDKYKKTNTIIAEYECSCDLLQGVQAMTKRIGEKYDIPSLFGMAWVMIMWNWFKVKIKNPLRDPNKMICSESIAILFQQSRVPDFLGWDAETTNPQMLWDYMNKSSYFTMVFIP